MFEMLRETWKCGVVNKEKKTKQKTNGQINIMLKVLHEHGKLNSSCADWTSAEVLVCVGTTLLNVTMVLCKKSQ